MTDNDRILLKQLIFSPQWRVVEGLIDEMTAELQHESKLKETDWETLRTVVFDEGQVRGWTRLRQRMNDLASQ